MVNKTSIILICFIMINVCVTSDGLSSVWKKFQKDPCAGNNYKLLSLLNLLCNSTQVTNLTQRDACYGCFFRAGNQQSGPTQLQMLSDCANLYINGSTYSTCAVSLNLIVNGSTPTSATPTSFCYNGYCDFVRCVRRINANTLIGNCVQENVGNFDLTQQAPRINFYTNVTACILARARCNAFNPITGILQQPSVTQFGSIFGYEIFTTVPNNALQISPYGDIRIISFPNGLGVGELFCSRNLNLDQAAYNSLTC